MEKERERWNERVRQLGKEREGKPWKIMIDKKTHSIRSFNLAQRMPPCMLHTRDRQVGRQVLKR